VLVQQVLLAEVDVPQADLLDVLGSTAGTAPESPTSASGPVPVSTATGIPCMFPEGVIDEVL
jgi:hypothetical protein